MDRIAKLLVIGACLSFLTACTGHIENKQKIVVMTTCFILQYPFRNGSAAAARLKNNHHKAEEGNHPA